MTEYTLLSTRLHASTDDRGVPVGHRRKIKRTLEGFRLRRDIKRTVERFRKERRTLDRLNVDPDMASSELADHDHVIDWIQTLRQHVAGGHRKQGLLTCNTCTLLAYLCMAFMNPKKETQYGPLSRFLLGGAVAATAGIIAVVSTSRLLEKTREVNDLGDAVLMGIIAGVFSTAFVAVAPFVGKLMNQVPHDLPPFSPIWIDRWSLMKERRLRHLRFTADEVLKRHGPVATHPRSPAASTPPSPSRPIRAAANGAVKP